MPPRRPHTTITQRDYEISCHVLNGKTQAATGALYGLSKERVRIIVNKAVWRHCGEFYREHLGKLWIGTNRVNLCRTHRDELLPLLAAAVER